MDTKKFTIVSKKFRGDSMVVSTRLPNTLIEKVDEIASLTGRTRNELVQKCIEFAIENLEIKENDDWGVKKWLLLKL